MRVHHSDAAIQPATISVWLDEELQVVRQRISANLSAGAAEQLFRETERCVARLRNPGSVRILADVRGSGRGEGPGGREMLIQHLARVEVKKLAVCSSSPLVGVVCKFFQLVSVKGKDKIRAFRTEAEALQWLREEQDL